MLDINPQIIRSGTDELVVLTRSEYDALVALASSADEEAEDAAIFDARMTELEAGQDARLPVEVGALMLRGYSLLKALRTWKDQTQTYLSFKTDLSQGFISELEAGRKTAAPETLRKIAVALDVDPACLEHLSK